MNEQGFRDVANRIRRQIAFRNFPKAIMLRNTTKPLFPLLLLLLTLCSRFSTAADKVLFLGDSWAELAQGDVFEAICENSEVVNEGIGGTTAQQWRTTDNGDYLRNILQDNLDTKSVWISLGGNDLLESNCNNAAAAAAIVDNLRAVISIVVSQLPNAKILLTSYGRFPCSDAEVQCTTAAFLEFATQLVTIADEFPTVAYLDSMFLFGGSVDELSPGDLWEDCIHLNTAGYQVLWRSDAKQHICPSSAFGPATTFSPTNAMPSAPTTAPVNSASAPSSLFLAMVLTSLWWCVNAS